VLQRGDRRAGHRRRDLTANPIVRKLSFTGSTEIGAQADGQCAPTIKKPRWNSAATRPSSSSTTPTSTPPSIGAMASKYRNTGQTCVCANRMLVQDGVYDAFAAKLAKAVEPLKVGNGMEAGVTKAR
jgi:succinate-semialdehyde dehydrogenase/glutarate-semialdehyde dehydrogenase